MLHTVKGVVLIRDSLIVGITKPTPPQLSLPFIMDIGAVFVREGLQYLFGERPRAMACLVCPGDIVDDEVFKVQAQILY